jgi:hypothetical protein
VSFLTDQWEWQRKIDQIEVWMNGVATLDVFAFLDCVTLVRQKPQPKYRSDFMLVYARKEIRQHLEFLSLPELRLLTSVLDDIGSGKAA